MIKNNSLKLIFFLSILGVVLSGYLTYLHYSDLNSPCDFNETFQCSIVKKSQYAEMFGIPVAILGLLGYTALGGISYNLWKKKEWQNKLLNKINNFSSPKVLLILSLIAVAMSLYLTYAEFFLIKAVCIFCLISQGTIFGIAGLSYRHHRLSKFADLEETGVENEVEEIKEAIKEEIIETIK